MTVVQYYVMTTKSLCMHKMHKYALFKPKNDIFSFLTTILMHSATKLTIVRNKSCQQGFMSTFVAIAIFCFAYYVKNYAFYTQKPYFSAIST